MSRGYFVTGTDTNVGKTRIACTLLHALAKAGVSAVGMKPVAAGAVRDADGLLNDDVVALMDASTAAAPRALVNPYCFESPIAPHIAASDAGEMIELDAIVRAFDALAAMADVVVVEGAGGFCVPLGDRIDGADLAQHLALPVVLVVGLRLGCLNHALLTAQAIRARGLELAGWIANRIDPQMAAVEQNIATLKARMDAPLLGDYAYAPAETPRRLAEQFDLGQLGIV